MFILLVFVTTVRTLLILVLFLNISCVPVHRLNAVEDLMANPGLLADSKEVLRVLPDLERLLKKYVQSLASLVPCTDYWQNWLLLMSDFIFLNVIPCEKLFFSKRTQFAVRTTFLNLQLNGKLHTQIAFWHFWQNNKEGSMDGWLRNPLAVVMWVQLLDHAHKQPTAFPPTSWDTALLCLKLLSVSLFCFMISIKPFTWTGWLGIYSLMNYLFFYQNPCIEFATR